MPRHNITTNLKVKPVALTVPVSSDEGLTTSEDIISYCARVSNPENQKSTETTSRLLRYLIKHKHWSPFDMVDVIFEIECPRDISRQILRHISMRFQEFSQRYQSIDKIGFIKNRECRLQDTDNRQNSLSCDDFETIQAWQDICDDVINYTEAKYKLALSMGIAKECARAVLPEGLTSSRLYVKGSLRSWIHYTEVRCDETTQKEHRVIANKVLKEVKKFFPSLVDHMAKTDETLLEDYKN